MSAAVAENGGLALYGLDLFGDVVKPQVAGPLADKFTVSPFSVLDARSGDWQERKDAWKRLGIKSEVGRKDDMAGASWGAAWMEKHGDGCARDTNGTSVFDPLLCELAYRWFSPDGGQIVDPFAGGSVRGIVAGALGRKYWGCDLRAEQIAANEAQADAIPVAVRPQWVCGDSMETLATAPEADMVFSCPPYGDLEVYSDNPNDLSAMDWHAFSAAYKRIILRAVQRMKPDTFACFVVGDFRDNKGFYRNFVSLTIEAFEECGARLYNEAILLQATGTAAMRATKQFQAGRKLVKLHQNVLVFCKGDWKKATQKCNDKPT